MFSLLFLALAIVTALAHVFIRRRRGSLTGKAATGLILNHFLFVTLGVQLTISGLAHIFMADAIARSIGWPPGSPFQFEVGLQDVALGILGLLSPFFPGSFGLAAIVGSSIFSYGAAYGHLRDTLAHGNYAAYNVGMIIPDAMLPSVLIVLYLIHQKMEKRTPSARGGEAE